MVWTPVSRAGSTAIPRSVVFAKPAASKAFRIKLILLALAGLNALTFHLTVYRQAVEWDVIPRRARLAGMVSLLLWIGIIAAGRSIAYGPGYDQ
jgi:hypothetical protein